MDWDLDVDVVCVGSGCGGLAAAVAAAEAGASVLVIEKGPLVGGASAISSGQVWAGATAAARKAGIADSRAEVSAYLEALSNGLATPKMRATFADRGPEAVDYFAEVIGIPFNVVRGLPDYYHPILAGAKSEGRYHEVEPFDAAELGDWAGKVRTSPYGDGYSYTTSAEWVSMQLGTGEPIWESLARHQAKDERCAGAGLIGRLLKAALDRGVTVWLDAGATRLFGQDGAVLGLLVSTVEGERRVRARRGVVLACGGYDWNADFVRAYEALPEAGSMSPPECEGDHLVMAAEMGAIPMACRAPAQTPTFVGYKVPGEEVFGRPSWRMWLPGAPHSIVVNRQGRRFADDSFYPDVATKVRRFDGQGQGTVNWPAWIVFDASMLEKYGLMPIPPGGRLPQGMATTADTLGELARVAGLDAAGLEAAVDRFNGFCQSGADEDFARGTMPWGRIMTGDSRLQANPNLAPIATPPFYAVRLEHVAMSVGSSGLVIDERAQVQDARGRPIPGLYAAGNAASWQDIGGGYNSGISLTRGLLYGYLAARAMTDGLRAGI